MTAQSLNINYFADKCELCEIGSKYDTDKSSQRKNVTNTRHCHPYTLFYNSLFQNHRNKSLNIAELGILDGGSLMMWKEYFPHAKIYGYDNDKKHIENFKNKYNNDNITLSEIDVTNKENISDTFKKMGMQYDIIIEDTTHQFEDQIRIIENTYEYLKPGGIMIIEDIFKKYDENRYIERLESVLQHFENYYFVTLDHKNRNSTGWDNDKLFILVKNGEPIFKNPRKMTIITPSYRTTNVRKLKESIDFEYVNEWIIVYDGNKILENPQLFPEGENENGKIKEYVYKGEGKSGNPQRNYALDLIESQNKSQETYIYFLDDDNVIHPDFYALMDILDDKKIYTFNQENRIKGNNINVGHIDTAMVLMDYTLCKNKRWILNKYDADGYFIKDCYESSKDSWVYIDNNLCYYNAIVTGAQQQPSQLQRRPRKYTLQ